MVGLRANDGFVSDAGSRKKVGTGRVLSVILVLLLVIGGISAFVLVPFDYSASPSPAVHGYRQTQYDFGSGYKNPQVVQMSSLFVVATVDWGKLTVYALNATDGSLVWSKVMTAGGVVNKYYFRMAYDNADNAVLVTWMNSTYINGTFIIGQEGNLFTTYNFTISNEAGTTGYGVAYGSGEFMVSWSTTHSENYFRMVKFNASDPDNPDLGPILKVSPDTHSHAQNFVGYDSQTNHFVVVWRNYSGLSGLYNITARIFDDQGNPVTGDILVADGVVANTKYDYPSVEGGAGKFFIAYVNYNSPYDVHGAIMNASSGEIEKSFQIGSSAKYGASYLGIAFNGGSFVVAWTDSSYDIVAMPYDTSGNATLSQPLSIAVTGDSEEWQDVAYNPTTNTYYFVWYDYTAKKDYGALWAGSDIPEFSELLSFILLLTVGIIIWKRKS